MIVVDATVVVASLLSIGGGGARARERLRLDADLHVPHLLDFEVTSALHRRVRLGQTDVEVATQALADLVDLPARRRDHEPLLRRVWELRDNVTTYDAV